MSRAGMDKQPAEIAAMFDSVAERYDRTNAVLALGRDRAWRRETMAALGLRPGEVVLDLAAGTGVSTSELDRAGVRAVAVDLSLGMIEVGRRERPDVTFVAGDALALPFAEETFDAVTMSFGLRNVADTDAALREMLRVTKPGGRLLICEFSQPTLAPVRTVYQRCVMWALPGLAKQVAGSTEAYAYLVESIRTWPDQQALADLMMAAGWGKVAWRNLTGGVVAMHRAIRP
ncbi:MAG: demethylmenaquinone methyltransferase [Dactylosporangium sp.]|nr:demethylmenaquinone methyltransferase [Dactylosporangium sp.]NNJ62463.1 demethylmenaquinone methyltransferase [Dactylosporangium sp.]